MLPVERACVQSDVAREESRERVSAGVRQLPLIVSGAALACVAPPGWVAVFRWVAGRAYRRLSAV